MKDFADRGAAVGEEGDAVFVSRPGDGGVGDAVLGHHAADEDFRDAPLPEELIKVCLEKAVGEFLDDDGSVGCGGEDVPVDGGAFGAFIEERGGAHRRVGDVLDVDDVDAR